MANNELKEFRAESRAFAAKHLKECAAEIIEWQDTAILRDGRVRELAALCGKFIANHDQLRVAESMINRAAIDAIATPAQAEPSGALPEPIGYAQKQPLLEYAPLTMLYSKKLAPEDMHECVALYSEDQVRDLLLRAYAKQAIEARGGALTDADIRELVDKFGMGTIGYENEPGEYCKRFARGIESRILGQQGGGDAALLDAIRDASWNVECFEMPTGGDDSDIGWRVVGHYMAAPHKRTIAEVYEDDPRKAILAAIKAQAGDAREGGGHAN